MSDLQQELLFIGKNIRTLREGRAWNQQRLAELAGTRQGTISLLEKGQSRNPGWELIDRIARALNVKVEDLLALPEMEMEEELIPFTLADLLSNPGMYLGESVGKLAEDERRLLSLVYRLNPKARDGGRLRHILDAYRMSKGR